MSLTDRFQRGVTIGSIKEDELRKAKVDLQMARSQSRQSMQDLERRKQAQYEKAVNERNKDLRRSYLSEISTIGFQMQLERRMLEGLETEVRHLAVVEAVKDFQRRRVQSPLLEKLTKIRFADMDQTMNDIGRQLNTSDAVSQEIMRRWNTGFGQEGSSQIDEMDAEIERAQAEMGAGADARELAARLNQKHSDGLEQGPLSA